MEENYQDQVIENLRREFEALTTKFQPTFTDKDSKNKDVSLIEFWNRLYEQINNHSPDTPVKMTIQLGESQFSFNTDNITMIRTVEECFNKLHKDNFLLIPPEEFKEKSREIYGMFSFMLDSMKENAIQMQTIGHKYLSMNFESNGTKYISFLPIQEAIDFLNSIQPSSGGFEIPSFEIPSFDMPPTEAPKKLVELPVNQALYLDLKVQNKMLDRIPGLLEERFQGTVKALLTDDPEYWDSKINEFMDQIRPDYQEDYSSFDTTPKECEEVLKQHAEEVQQLKVESPNIQKQWDELAQRKLKIIADFLQKKD
jgi:hypothetical protein